MMRSGMRSEEETETKKFSEREHKLTSNHQKKKVVEQTNNAERELPQLKKVYKEI